jgi:hypothetical protein
MEKAVYQPEKAELWLVKGVEGGGTTMRLSEGLKSFK